MGRFVGALCDDLNTPQAIAELHAVARALGATPDPAEQGRLKAVLLEAGSLLGVLQEDPGAWLAGGADDDEGARIDAMVAARWAARQAKDFAEADRLRDAIVAEGISLQDSPEGTTWKRVR